MRKKSFFVFLLSVIIVQEFKKQTYNYEIYLKFILNTFNGIKLTGRN